jgi:hypothetical protein
MWAKVITLADITTGDGKHLTTECKEENFIFHCPRSIDWPKTGKPDRTCWKMWQEAIDHFLNVDDKHKKLSRPLGAWTVLPDDWEWHFSDDENKMYQHENIGHWRQWTRNQGHGPARHQGFRRTNTTLQTLPNSALPATAQGRHIKRPTGTSTILATPDVSDEKWWFEIIDAPQSIQPILQGISNGTAVWVTDGSYKDKYGTAGFILLPTIESQEGLLLVN